MKTVLVADDDPGIVDILTMRLKQLGVHVVTASDALAALRVVHMTHPDLAILDVSMPRGNGLSVVEMISSDPEFLELPVIVLTGQNNQEVVRRCHQLSAYYVPKGGDVWTKLAPLAEELLKDDDAAASSELTTPPIETEAEHQKTAEKNPLKSATPQPTNRNTTASAAPGEFETVPSEDPPMQHDLAHEEAIETIFSLLGADPDYLNKIAGQAVEDAADSAGQSSDAESIPWVLIVDDDPDFSLALKLRLEQHGLAVVRAFDGSEGYRQAFLNPASAIILDYNMPNGRGDYTLRRLKENPITRSIPVIVATGCGNSAVMRQMMSLGAECVMGKPIDNRRLLDELRKHVDLLPSPQPSLP